MIRRLGGKQVRLKGFHIECKVVRMLNHKLDLAIKVFCVEMEIMKESRFHLAIQYVDVPTDLSGLY